MKNTTAVIFAGAMVLLQACGAKQESLEDLVAQRQQLDERIAAAEASAGQGAPQAELKVKYVEVKEIKETPFRHFIEVQGVADTDNNIMLTAKAAGTVKSVTVKEGAKVAKGQLLVSVDDDIIRSSISEINTSLELATEIYEKQKSLWEQKIGSEVQYLQAKNNKEALEGRLATLKEQLSQTKIYSPISGTVESVSIKVGEMASPGMPLVRVVNLSEFEIKATVAENHSLSVKSGTKVMVYFPDLKQEVESTISFVGSVIDPINRTFDIIVRLKNPNIGIKPNMVAVVKIQDYSQEAGIVIPVNIIQYTDGGKYVFIASEEGDKSVARRREVISDINYNGMALIAQGLKPSEKIVTFGFQDLNDGQTIKF